MRSSVLALLFAMAAAPAAGTVTVDLVAGPAPDLLVTQGDPVSPGMTEYFGWAMAVGDYDGDGTDDLAVSGASPTAGATSGAVYIFYGGPFVAPSEIDLSDPAVSADLTIFAAGSAAEGFGQALASGDIDADGDDELFIGAIYASTDDATFPPGGVVSVLLGPLATTGFRDVTSPSGEPELQYQAAGGPADSLGAALASGDVDADGFDELIIGAPTSAGGEGAVWLIDFQEAVAPFQLLPPDLPEPGISEFATGEAAAQLGRSVAVGDIDEDSADDVIVGAPFFDGGKGKVYVLSSDSGVLDFVTPDPGTHLGYRVAAGDVNGDGAADIVMGAPGADASAPVRMDAGAVYVVLGPGPGGVLPGATADITIIGAKGDPDGVSNSPAPGSDLDDPGGLFGSSIATGDMDRDGAADLVVGAPYEDGSTALYGGRAYALTGLNLLSTPATLDMGSAATPTTMIIGEGSTASVADPELFGDFMGFSAACGDFNGDGVADMIAAGVSDPFVLDKGKVALQLGIPVPSVPALSSSSVGVLLLILLGLGALCAGRLKPNVWAASCVPEETGRRVEASGGLGPMGGPG